MIDKGAVREQGSHEELLAAGGLYAEMWKDYQKAAAWKVERGSEAVREPGGMPVGEEEYR